MVDLEDAFFESFGGSGSAGAALAEALGAALGAGSGSLAAGADSEGAAGASLLAVDSTGAALLVVSAAGVSGGVSLCAGLHAPATKMLTTEPAATPTANDRIQPPDPFAPNRFDCRIAQDLICKRPVNAGQMWG